MAGFKTQIIARFKVKFPKVTLSKERLNSIADKLDAKTDDEDSIDGNLDAMNEFFPFADIQKADDKIRDLEGQVKKKPETKETENEPQPVPADMPEWAKGLVTGMQTLTSEITTMKGEKVTNTRKEQLAEKLKDAPEAVKNKILKDFGRMKFEKDEDFTEYLTDTETDLGTLIQDNANLGLGIDRPGGGKPTGTGGKTKEATKEELDSVMTNIKI